MSLKVAQNAVAPTAASRASAINHAAPTDLFKQVSGMSGATPSGPEDESLRFGENWDGLYQKQDKSNKKTGRTPLESVRFGDIITTEEVSLTLVSYQAANDLSTLTPLRIGAMLYEKSMRAINNNGTLRPLGGNLSRIL
jgi:hypothetical protein